MKLLNYCLFLLHFDYHFISVLQWFILNSFLRATNLRSMQTCAADKPWRWKFSILNSRVGTNSLHMSFGLNWWHFVCKYMHLNRIYTSPTFLVSLNVKLRCLVYFCCSSIEPSQPFSSKYAIYLETWSMQALWPYLWFLASSLRYPIPNSSAGIGQWRYGRVIRWYLNINLLVLYRVHSGAQPAGNHFA